MTRKRAPSPLLSSLELSPDEMRAVLDRAAHHVIQHVASLPEQPMHAVSGGQKLAASLREPIPERGHPFEALATQLFSRILPRSLNTASPGYLAYIPSGGLFQAAVADLIAAATNRYAGVWRTAPALAEIEAIVVDWFRVMLGMPEGSGGALTSGGSMANFMAIVAARAARLPPDFLRGTIYCSDQTHHSVLKAARLAGFPLENVRQLPADERFRLAPDAVERAVADDRARGMEPFFLVANAGTTNTGAVDPLPALADLCQREGLWLHVDAAYGGFFALTERGRRVLDGIGRADSVTLDPHKGLFLPYGAGSLVVRDMEALRAAHRVPAAYLPPPDPRDAADLSPELSREGRGLRVWLPLKMHGVGVFREQLDEKLDLAAHACQALGALPGVLIEASPELSLLAFRYRPAGVEDGPFLDQLNHRLLSAINASQRVFLSGTTLRSPGGGARFVLRLCILSFRTHRDRIDEAIDIIARALSSLAVAPPP